jgi:hypothetical protein
LRAWAWDLVFVVGGRLLEYEAGDRTADASGTLEEVNDQGVFVSEGDTAYFYPWRNVVRIGSGHKPPRGPRGRGTVRVRQ